MNLLKRLWYHFLKSEPQALCCPRCHSPLPDTPEEGFLYCASCHTSFETFPEIHYDEPTRGITYSLSGKSWYGKR